MNKKDIASKITYENIKKIMESKNYITTDRIVWDTMKAIKKVMSLPQKGQDIYSTCLEGPPGSGKTFYVKTYKKVLEDLTGEPVKMIEYSCDSTTGKTDLYEDIRVSSAITGNPEDVIIAGKLIEAIDAVNNGQVVLLFLDEFEKSRAETDNFLNQFLQDGTVSTSQQGTISVAPEYRQNLQVFLAKNYGRDLADQLLRRNHRIELEIMSPENFKKTVEMNLPETDEDIRNVVILLYQKMYEKKDEFAKFPSCSEGMLGIQDACTLLSMNAPADIIYADILSNMLKHPDDIDTFRVLFEKDAQLKGFCNQILRTEGRDDDNTREQIYRSFFAQKIQETAKQLAEKDIEMARLKFQHEKELGDITEAHNRTKQLVERLTAQCEQLKRSKREEANSSGTSITGTAIQVEENLIDMQAIKDAVIKELDMNDINNLIIAQVPKEFVGKKQSVFCGSDKWYEIRRIEVDEDRDWEILEFDLSDLSDLENDKRSKDRLKLFGCLSNKPEFSPQLKEYMAWHYYQNQRAMESLKGRLDDIRKYVGSPIDKKKVHKDGIVFTEDFLSSSYIYRKPKKDGQRALHKTIGVKIIENGKEYYAIYANTPLVLERYLHYNKDYLLDRSFSDDRLNFDIRLREFVDRIRNHGESYIAEHFDFLVQLDDFVQYKGFQEPVSCPYPYIIDQYGRLIERLEYNTSYIKNIPVDFSVKRCKGNFEEILTMLKQIKQSQKRFHTIKDDEADAVLCDKHAYLCAMLMGEEYQKPEAVAAMLLRDELGFEVNNETPEWIKKLVNVKQSANWNEKPIDDKVDKQKKDLLKMLSTYDPREERKKNEIVTAEDEGR